MAQSQTADSALTVTDTSVSTNNNVVVTDSAGSTTLFAGGQQSGFSGKVGVGTSAPAYKLTVYDDAQANFRLSQKFKPDTTHTSNFRAAKGSNFRSSNILGNNGAPIENFDISITNEEMAEGVYPPGTVLMQATCGAYPSGRPTINNNVGVAPDWSTLGCPQSQDPDFVMSAKSFGWATQKYGANGCPIDGVYDLQMTLSPNGDLVANGGGTFRNGLWVGKNNQVDYTAAFINNNHDGKGVRIIAGGAGFHSTPYDLLSIEDNNANRIMNLTGSSSLNTLTLNGEFIITNQNTGNKILEVHQADNYVYARDIHVTQNNFPDYVFNKDYHLMGLHDLENYINANHHLPEMPTAKEVVENNLSVSETTTLLTKKIEELTLYMIELKKENEEIKAELKELRK